MFDRDNRRTSYDGTLTKQRDPLELKAANAESGILTGYASKFWAVDSYGEVTAPGAFLQTIADRGPTGANRILLRYEHNVTIGTHTAMAEDQSGLAIEAHISDDGMDGTRVRRHLADGVAYGLSIGFRRMSDRSADESDPLDFSTAPPWVQTLPRNEIRVLTGVKLYENSVVSFPANDPSLVESYRSEPIDFDALVAAVKAGRLTADQTAQLNDLMNATPADGPQADGETPAAARLAQTAQRQRQADLTFLLAELRQRGIGVDL